MVSVSCRFWHICEYFSHHNKDPWEKNKKLQTTRNLYWDNINSHFRSEVEKMLPALPMNWLNIPKVQCLLVMWVLQWDWWSNWWTFLMHSCRSWNQVRRIQQDGVITRYVEISCYFQLDVLYVCSGFFSSWLPDFWSPWHTDRNKTSNLVHISRNNCSCERSNVPSPRCPPDDASYLREI